MIDKSRDNTKGIIFLLGSALLYSIMPVLIRMLGSGHVPPMSQVFLRYIFAFISALIYFLLTKSKFFLAMKDLLFLLLVATFGYALTNLFFTYGILYTQVSTGLFIFYCFSIITPILGYLVLKEKLNRFNVIAVGLTLVALLLLFRPNSLATWKLGGFFALLSAFGQSFYLISRKKLSRYSSQLLLLISTFTGVVVLGLLAFIFERSFYAGPAGIVFLTPNTWLVTILFGMDNFFAWLLMSKGFQYIKSALGSILLLSELIFATSFAYIFFREIPTLFTIFGGALIVTSSLLIILKGDNS